MAVVLTDRGGNALYYAVAWLVIGGFAGVLIRPLNDPVSKLIGPYRRARALRRWAESAAMFPGQREKVAMLVADAEDAIRMLDVAAAEDILTQLEKLRLEDSPEARADSLKDIQQLQREGARDLPSFGGIGRVMASLFGGYWIIVISASVFVVVATGVATLYVQKDSFAGTQRDWASLVLFGLTAQVTLTTFAEALGRSTPTANK